MLDYYPRQEFTLREFKDEFSSLGLEFVDGAAMDRDEHLEGLKFRGKQAPKKKKGPPGNKPPPPPPFRWNNMIVFIVANSGRTDEKTQLKRKKT